MANKKEEVIKLIEDIKNSPSMDWEQVERFNKFQEYLSVEDLRDFNKILELQIIKNQLEQKKRIWGSLINTLNMDEDDLNEVDRLIKGGF